MRSPRNAHPSPADARLELPSAAVAGSRTPTPTRSARRVLVADDDRITRDALREALSEEGYEVATADNGATALLLARDFAPELVITDIVMPVLDGLAVMSQLRRRDRRFPVVLMTGQSSPEIVRQARRAEAPCLAKPLDLELLLEQVERCLDAANAR